MNEKYPGIHHCYHHLPNGESYITWQRTRLANLDTNDRFSKDLTKAFYDGDENVWDYEAIAVYLLTYLKHKDYEWLL